VPAGTTAPTTEEVLDVPTVSRPAPARRPSLAAPVAVTAIGGLLSLLTLTGVAGQRPAAATTALPQLPPVAANRPFAERPDAVLPAALTGHATTTHARTTPARSSRSSSRAPLHRWVRPFWGYLSSTFGYRWGRLHAGIDLAGAYGAPIVAATDGVITYAGPESGYGRLMTIQDWDGTVTAYGHMSAFARTSGYVHAGEVIAYVGSAGDATGPHLHFEVRVGGSPIDPLPFLRKRGVDI
jgi:murein DD-endopeptidase MepM/ murein hydrolase activator NlpD